MIWRRDKIPVLPLLRLLIGFGLLVAIGCALNPDDGKDPPPVEVPDYSRAAPDSLIAFFAEAYQSKDSTNLDACLDSSYTFLNLEELIDDEWYPGEWWDREEELDIAGRMFSSWANQSGASVQSIDLILSVSSNTVDNTNHPGKPPGEEWRKIIASVDMTIVVDDPESADGVMNYIILSNQIFICKPDYVHEGLWTIYKQEDQLFAN